MNNKKRKSLSEVTAEKVIDYIQQNHLNSGDQLPNEQILSEILDVGRGTIREAIKTLVSRNIVTIKRGCGTFVASNPGISQDPLGFQFVDDKKNLAIELLEVRLIIEPALAKMAAKNALPHEINRLQEIENMLEAAHLAGENHSLYDIEFHKQIAACTHNHITEQLIPILVQGIPAAVQYTKGALIEKTIIHHQKIIDAIQQHDYDAAQAVMQEHLNMNIQYILED